MNGYQCTGNDYTGEKLQQQDLQNQLHNDFHKKGL